MPASGRWRFGGWASREGRRQQLACAARGGQTLVPDTVTESGPCMPGHAPGFGCGNEPDIWPLSPRESAVL